MKKAKEILLLVGGILQIAGAVGFAIAGLVFAILSGLKDFIVEGLSNGTITSDLPGTPEEQAAAVSVLFITFAVLFFLFTAFNIVGAIITFKARKAESKPLLIATIVFGVLGGTEVAAVGAVFGLISNGKAGQPAIEEAEPVEETIE